MQKRDVDFYGEIRSYPTNYSFNGEWNIKVLANSKEEVAELLKLISSIFFMSDQEIDYINSNGQFISKKIV